MKLNLPTVEDTDRINYRIPISIKAELDELAERCKKAKLDFNAALFEGLRSVARAIRQELDGNQIHRGAKSGTSVTPAAASKLGGQAPDGNGANRKYANGE